MEYFRTNIGLSCLQATCCAVVRRKFSKDKPRATHEVKRILALAFGLRQILIVVRARNQNYDKSPTFSMTVDVPKGNFADSFP